MIIARPDIMSSVRKALLHSPAAALPGPRQVGKTTLARTLEKEVESTLYLDLKRSSDLRELEDPGALLQAQAGHLTILDEVHSAPNLFSELRGIIDERRQALQRHACQLLGGTRANRRSRSAA
jgi:uncharacterized protein